MTTYINKINYYNKIDNLFILIAIGNIIEIKYFIIDNLKKITEISEGIIIKKTNKSFTIKFNIQGIFIEQIFFFNSVNLISIKLKKKIKIKKSKLYYLKKNIF